MAALAKQPTETMGFSATDVRRERRKRYLKLFDVGVLLAALIIFLVFLNLLVRVVFPQGSRLSELALIEDSALPDHGGRGNVDIAGGADSLGAFTAFLGDVRRDVKIRSADSIAWKSASRGTAVRNRDAVQTFANSRARVDFTTDNTLQIGQNSLVVFSNGAADPFLARRESAVLVMEGEMSGEINADYGTFGVEFPAGLVELKAADGADELVNFRIGVNPDQSSTIAIYSGRADVNVAGEHFLVTANEGLTIDKDGTTSGVTELPSMPSVRQPAGNRVFPFLHAPPKVTFAWNSTRGARKYRLEIGKNAGFDEIVVDEYLDDTSFVHGNLAAGNYYWRVSAVAGWVQGPSTSTRRFRVVPDTEPPPLELLPIEQLSLNEYVLRGSAGEGATVYAVGKRVITDPEGRFEVRFNPEPGAHPVVVEAVDAVGNVSYRSQVLHVSGGSRRSE